MNVLPSKQHDGAVEIELRGAALLGREAAGHDPVAAGHHPTAVPRPRPRGRTAPLPPQISMRAVALRLALVDALLASAVVMLGLHLRGDAVDGARAYTLFAVTVPPAWIIILTGCGAYDRRALVVGPEEYRRVFTAGVWLIAGVAFTSYATHADLSRVIVAFTTPLIVALTLVGRVAGRKRLHRRVREGRAIWRVVVAGSREEARELICHMRRASHAGFSLIGACVPGRSRTLGAPGGAVPVLGPIGVVAEAALDAGADTIAIAGMSMLSTGELRRLSWQLEGTGTQLIVAPAIADIAGPRIQVLPIAGLPLLHVQEPQFTGGRRLIKEALDRTLAVVLLALLSPLILAVAAAVLVGSGRPVLFRQMRVGQFGKSFVLWKFRTMCEGPERRHLELLCQNEHDGPLFKMRQDPRVTPVGRWLRRFSLDELPQLWNVVAGSMSLVGPRPPLPSEAAQYERDVHRRLLVKPGMTGLWQVSGRAELPWEEAVRLDLYYVENWSVSMDLALLCRTLMTVLRGGGS